MEEKNMTTAEVPQFTAPKSVPKYGRGFMTVIAVQAVVCAVIAAFFGIAYLAAPDVFSYAVQTLLEAAGL